jgi:8-oxo-dGTP diphosphatase
VTVPRPEVAVGAIVVRDGMLLLVRRGRGAGAGRWSVPGGRLEWGETLAGAVVRELREETGLDGVCERFVGWVERISADYHYVIVDFAVTVVGGELRAGDDAAEATWVDIDDVGAWPPVVDGLVEFLATHGVVGPGATDPSTGAGASR